MCNDRDEWYHPTDKWRRDELDAMKLSDLAEDVGGYGVLERLDDAPLPDEPFDWTDIGDDVAPRVRAVL